MNGTRARKQTPKASRSDSQKPTFNSDTNGKVNGNITANRVVIKGTEPSENIFLFYPNIIGMWTKLLSSLLEVIYLTLLGYSRIILAIASLYYMPLHPRTCSLLYSISCLLDALDGVAARYFQQSTRFGAVLDMVTDRCTTACLLVFLSSAWPRWALLFQGLISLDLASHYMHMYATLTMAGSGQSHKKVDQSRSRILYLYYNNKVCTLRLDRERELMSDF